MAIGPDEAAVSPPKTLQPLLDFQRHAGRLVDTPPTDLGPAGFQAEATRLLRGLPGLTRKNFVGDALLRAGSAGSTPSDAAPSRRRACSCSRTRPRRRRRSATSRWSARASPTTRAACRSRSAAGMVGMKADMGGAAAVLGAFAALVKGGAPCKVGAVMLHGRERHRPGRLQARRRHRVPFRQEGRDQQHRRRGAPAPR